MSTAARARQEPRRLELVASEIASLPGVETHGYRGGEGPLPPERLKRLDVYVRDGALGLRLAVGRANRDARCVRSRVAGDAPGVAYRVEHRDTPRRRAPAHHDAGALRRRIRAAPDREFAARARGRGVGRLPLRRPARPPGDAVAARPVAACGE